ncbi:MAG TPA: outer membrane protein assembly factor BamE [Usitatibacter sp.]|nr:outer membrane protein assembly factor BamE [Usitatibacter sp.]
MRPFAVVLCSLALAGCNLVYKIDVQQGNYVTEDVVARVKTGMTKAEVRQILGTPLVADIFHANRWDYYFSSVKNHKAENRTLLSVFFESDKVVAVKGESHPPAPPPVGQAGAAAPASSSASPAAPASTPSPPAATPAPTAPTR